MLTSVRMRYNTKATGRSNSFNIRGQFHKRSIKATGRSISNSFNIRGQFHKRSTKATGRSMLTLKSWCLLLLTLNNCPESHHSQQDMKFATKISPLLNW